MHIYRKPTPAQQQLKKAQSDLLDTQETAASLFEGSLELQAQLLDTQEAVALLFEMGGTA